MIKLKRLKSEDNGFLTVPNSIEPYYDTASSACVAMSQLCTYRTATVSCSENKTALRCKIQLRCATVRLRYGTVPIRLRYGCGASRLRCGTVAVAVANTKALVTDWSCHQVIIFAKKFPLNI